jgi:ABC-type sugar transport system ATPase subunit
VAAIEISSICKRFGQVVAVDDVSLAIADGEFIVLVGPSGCGKTTLLRIIAGLSEADGGSLLFNGRDVTGEPPGARNVAMVFQNYALFPHMNVERNLSFGLRLRRVPIEQRRARVAEVAQLLHLEELLARFPRELSGGQKQRVALGRALIRQPLAFLFDEPLSNLDPALRVEMRAEIIQLHRRLRITTVYVTHDQVEAMTMGDRIAVMHEGRLRQVGEPREIYRRPGDAFTAGFIGSPAMNLIEMESQQDGPGWRLRGTEGVELRVAQAAGLPSPDAGGSPASRLPTGVVIGIRPEHLLLCAADAPGAIGAEVQLVEELGREHIVHLRRGGLALRLVTREVPPTLGTLVHAAPDIQQLHIFDAASGQRLAGWN